MNDDIVKLTCDFCDDELHISAKEYDSLKRYYRSGAAIRCDKCLGAKRPPHAPGTAPDTSLHLGDERKEWLRQQGGIQPTIIRLIDEAMYDEALSR